MGTVDRIPIGDFPLGSEEKKALQRVIDSGRITEGREVRAFEEEFADYIGAKHCVAVSSGTAALMVGLRALMVSKQFHVTEGARVLIPALAFIAVANAVKMAGGRPMFGDIDPATMGLDPSALDRSQIGGVDIVLPVHTLGFAADIETIQAKCAEHKPRPLLLVEDASEAHGTTVGGKKVGTFGIWGAFSFYPAHIVQAGELGAIVTDSAEIAQVCRQLKAHGRQCHCLKCTRNTTVCPYLGHGTDPRFTAEYIGWNFKPMEFPAALGRVQIKNIEENIERRQIHRDHLSSHFLLLEDTGQIEILPLQTGAVPFAFPIVLKRSGYRNHVVTELERRGVGARPLFGCIPTQQPSFIPTEDITAKHVPIAHHYGADGFYVGCHQYLSSEQVDRMAKIIQEVIREVVS